MQCNNCKNVIEEHTKFCAYCGAKVLTNYEQNSQQTNLVQNTLQDDNYNLPISNQNNINNQTNIVQQNNNDNNKKVKKKKKHRLLKFLLLVLIIFVVFKIANSYKEGLNKIYLMSSEIYEKKDNSNFYKLDKKINKISLKIRTFKNVKKATIKLSSYNLILFDEEYTDKKKWKIEYVSLS